MKLNSLYLMIKIDFKKAIDFSLNINNDLVHKNDYY